MTSALYYNIILSSGALLIAWITWRLILAVFYNHRRNSAIANLPLAENSQFLLGHLPLLQVNPHRVLHDWGVQYGPAFRIKLGTRQAVVLNDGGLIRQLFIKHNAATASRPKLATIDALNRGVLSSFTFQPFNTQWKLMRKTAVHALAAFGKSGSTSLERICSQLTDQLIEKISQRLGEEMDVSAAIFECVASAMGTFCFGHNFDRNDASLAKFFQISKENSKLFGLQNYADFIPFGKWLAKSQYDRLQQNRNYVNEFVGRYLNASPAEDHGAMKADKAGSSKAMTTIAEELQKTAELQQACENETSTATTDRNPTSSPSIVKHIRAIAADLFAAGFTTTMDTIRWALLLVAVHPKVQEELQLELRSTIADSTGINEGLLSYIDKLPYTKAFITEVYRFAPVVPLSIFHNVDVDNISLSINEREYGLDRDSIIIPNIWSAHHNETIFPDSFVFKPERFLLEPSDSDTELAVDGFPVQGPESRSKRTLNQQLIDEVQAFGLGKRRCPGENIARQEVFLILTKLLLQYQIKLSGTANIEQLLHNPDGGFYLKAKSHKLIFQKRSDV